MIEQTHAAAPSSRRPDRDAATMGRPGRTQTVLGLMIAVAVLDQTTKYWGWRHATQAVINSGSTWDLWAPVSGWYSGSLTGPLMDLVSCGLLTLAVCALLRRPRPLVVLVSGALVIAGLSSNLLDRLAMHRVNAPGSPRGAVDFIGIGGHFYNVADLVIIAGAVAFLAAVCALALPGRSHRRSRAALPPVLVGRGLRGAGAGD